MAITKPKISSLVSSQLPAFIQEDYTTFVAFLEAYYEYLETQTIIDFDEISDIDTTLDSFVKYFKNELALNFPTTRIDDRFLLPKIKELYVSKGSEASFRLLFKMLYNKDIDIIYPATQLLRVSDGKWVQPLSIFVDIKSNSPDTIVGKYVDLTSTYLGMERKVTTFVDSYEPTITNGIYEFFILNNYTGVINIGDLLKYSSDYTGVVIATTTSLSIIQGGKNFKVDQTYDIIGPTYPSTITITSVDINGGVKSAKFTNYGIGYSSDFSTNILAQSYQTSTLQNFFTISATSLTTYSATIIDSINQIEDSGVISLYNYASTSGIGFYSDPTYAGVVKKTFTNASVNTIIDPLDYATFSINLGAIAKYPGYYSNTDGFLDDTMFIQDSKYYQAFSYAIQIDELFDSYKSIVKNLIHPAGTEIFGEYTINNEFSLAITTSASPLDTTIYFLIDESSNTLWDGTNNLIAIM